FAALAAVAVVLLVLNARATEARHLAQRRGDEAERNARKLSALLLGQYQSQGRRLVLADEPLQGLAYLARAAAEGARGPAHDFMVAQAIRATSGEIFVLESELSVQRVRFSPDGTRLVSTGYADQALLWDTASGARVAPLPHGAAVRRADVSPDGALVVTGADDGTVSLWRAADGAPVASWSTEQGPPQEVVASPAGDQLLVVGADDSAALWHLPSGRRIALLHPPSDTGSGILVGRPAAFSPDGARVAAGDGAGTVRVWDARRGGLIRALTGRGAGIMSVRFAPDGARLVTASFDGTARVWQLASGRAIHVLEHRDAVNFAAFDPSGRRVVTASNDRTAVVWDAATELGRASCREGLEVRGETRY